MEWTRCRYDSSSRDIHSRFEDQDSVYSTWVIAGDLAESDWAGDSYLISPYFTNEIRYEVDIFIEDDSVGSIVFRSNKHGTAGYLVCLDYGRRTVGLYKTFHGEPKQLIQERGVDINPGEVHKIKAITKGKFIEVYLDDALSLIRTDDTFQEGFWGLHASGRGVKFSNIVAEDCMS